jgi:NAD(P)-dependent dehydrogenase (short-subunit alcohol dehydrogenase family)
MRGVSTVAPDTEIAGSVMRPVAVRNLRIGWIIAAGKRNSDPATTPLKRIATAEDIASAILACATQLGFATGTTIVVDGGRSL